MGFDVADYKIQGYLLANAEELIEKIGRNNTNTANPQPVITKKAISPGNQTTFDTQSDLFNAFSNLNQVDFIADLPGKIRSKDLRPTVKIFKTLRGTEGKEADLELGDIYSIKDGDEVYDVYGTANGASVSDIEIVRLGGNPAEIDTNIKVTIRLHATSLGQFFEIRKPTPLLNFDGDIADLGEKFVRIADKGVAWIDLLKINLVEGSSEDDLTNFINTQHGGPETVAQVKAAAGGDIGEPQQRIKLELEYGVPDKIEGYSPGDVNKIKALIESQREVFYLSLTQHQITFNSDKSADIEISYIGSGGANVISRQNDILFDPFLYEKELQINDYISVFNRRSMNTDDEGKKSKLLALLSGLETTKAAMKKSQAMLLMNGLYGPANLLGHGMRGTDLLTELQGLDAKQLKSRIYVHPIMGRDMAIGAISGRLSTLTDQKTPIVGNYYNYFSKDADSLKRELPYQQADTQEEADSSVDNAYRYVEKGGKDALVSQFVFLGDIFEVALEVLASNNRFSTDESFNSKFFKISPDIMHDGNSDQNKELFDTATTAPGGVNVPTEFAEQLKEGVIDPTIYEGMFVRPFYWDEVNGRAPAGSARAPATKRLRRVYQEYGEFLCSDIVYQSPADANVDIKINLADLPISLYRYKQWFINKILAPRRTTLFLKDFIQLLITDLVAKILSEKYNPNETSSQKPPELLINRFSVHAEKVNFLRVLPRVSNSAYNSRTVDHIKDAFKLSDSSSLRSKQLTLFSQSPVVVSKPPPGQTRREADRKKNIPHIFFSDANNGILKELNFQREDMPGLREARLFEGSDFSGPGIIPEKYNSTLEVIGTSAFKPGSIFYIDPEPLVLGYTKDKGSPARKLGLGGYYLVLRVTHIVNLQGKATWQTMLDTQWQSFGDENPLRRKKSSNPKPTSIKTRMMAAVDLEDPSVLKKTEDELEATQAWRTGLPVVKP